MAVQAAESSAISGAKVPCGGVHERSETDIDARCSRGWLGTGQCGADAQDGNRPQLAGEHRDAHRSAGALLALRPYELCGACVLRDHVSVGKPLAGFAALEVSQRAT